MDSFDKILMGYSQDGFKFLSKTFDWGVRHLGTKKKEGAMGELSRGFGGGLLKSVVGGDDRVYIARFLGENPGMSKFSDFLDDAEKWVEGVPESDKIDCVLVVTPAKFDQKSVSALTRRTESVKPLLAYKVAGAASPPAPTLSPPPPGGPVGGPAPPDPEPKPAPKIAKPVATHLGEIDVLTIQDKLRDRQTGEDVLFVWDGDVLLNTGRTARSLLAVTQERGVFYRQFDEEYHNTGPEFRWEKVTNLASKAEGVELVLEINDGQTIHRFRHPQAPQMARLMYHLRSYREGMRTGFIKERRFDSELAEACTPSILQGRYLDAVRTAFTLLESRVREYSHAGHVGGHDLVVWAFQKDTGLLRFGRDDDERLGLFHLFEGSFKWFRNPAAHNYYLPDFGRDEALEELSQVDLLLKLAARGRDEARKRGG